jgi:hypothetical protein
MIRLPPIREFSLFTIEPGLSRSAFSEFMRQEAGVVLKSSDKMALVCKTAAVADHG